MQKMEPIKPGTAYLGRLEYGSDLLDSLTQICQDKSIFLGRVEAIGALQKARLGYYDQLDRKYRFFTVDRGVEIVSLMGNISVKDESPMVHAHLALSDEDGTTLGGHLAQGCVVFACEFMLHPCSGPNFIRGYDEQTGLPLWS